MRKGVIIDGEIKIFYIVPKTWNNILGFNNLSNEKLQEHGWYDISDADDFDDRFHIRGELKFDEAAKKFIYEKTDKNIGDIDDLKSEKIAVLKKMAFDRLKETDWYCTRKSELGTEIPDSIIADRKEIRDKVVERETEIIALTTQKNVVLYNVRIFDQKTPPELQ